MATRRRKRRTLRIRPVLMLLLATAVVIGAIALIVRSFSGTIGGETILFERAGVSAVVVRDEETLMTDALGGVEYLVDEGSAVPLGAPVAQVYRSGNNENLLQQLYNVQQQIYDYQINTMWQDVVNAELSNIQDRIALKYREIAQANGVQNADFLTLQKELTELLADRTAFLRQSTQPDNQLNEWYQSEKTIQDALDNAKEEMTSFATGRISFHLDGYEAVLNAKTLHLITAADVSDTLSRREVGGLLGERDLRPLYRIVQPDKWYLAIATSRKDNYVMAEGNSYQIQIVGEEQTFPAVVARAVRDEGGSLYILEVSTDVQTVMNIRSCSVNIAGQFSNLTVSKRAVLFDEDGNASIDVGSGYVAIEVISESEDKYVFRSNVPLQPGLHVTAPEK